MSSKKVRIIFIAVFALLPVQYALVGIIGELESEPWPAFVFPGFKSVYVYEAGYEIDQVFFDVYPSGNNHPKVFLPHELFPELPRSQISGFMRAHFQHPSSIENISENGRDWLKQQAERHLNEPVDSLDVWAAKMYYPDVIQTNEPDSVTEIFRVTIIFEGQ